MYIVNISIYIFGIPQTLAQNHRNHATSNGAHLMACLHVSSLRMQGHPLGHFIATKPRKIRQPNRTASRNQPNTG